MRGAGELAASTCEGAALALSPPSLPLTLPPSLPPSFVFDHFICAQLNQALAGKFNAHVHVEYEWCLQHEDLDESDEDLDEKVRRV